MRPLNYALFLIFCTVLFLASLSFSVYYRQRWGASEVPVTQMLLDLEAYKETTAVLQRDYDKLNAQYKAEHGSQEMAGQYADLLWVHFRTLEELHEKHLKLEEALAAAK